MVVDADEGGRMSVEAVEGKSLLPLLLGGREGRALVEELREWRVLGARWREVFDSVGVRAPLRREAVLLSEVNGGRLTPVLCGRIDAVPVLALVNGREIFVGRGRLAEELGGFGSRDGDTLPRSRCVSAGMVAVDLSY